MDSKIIKRREYSRKRRLKQLETNADHFKSVRAADQYRCYERKKLKEDEKNRKKPKRSFVGTEDCVKKFYGLELITRQLPGKKDFVTVKVDGVSNQVQKQVMLMTLAEAHLEFMKMFPERSISYSKFAKLRPKNVVLMNDTPPNSCCCIYCENMMLLFDAIKSHLPAQIKSISTLVSSVVCNIDNFPCMRGTCSSCCDVTSALEGLFDSDHGSSTIKLSRWDKVEGFMQKVHLSGRLKILQKLKIIIKLFFFLGKVLKEGIALLCTDFPYYKLHKYLVKSQLEHINYMKDNQPENHAIIIMDYSENYSTITSNEIQSAYFAKRQISIFTAIAYVGQNEPVTFLIGNDDINHAKDQVWLYQKKILSSLVEGYPAIDHIDFVSDGCAGQFKNRFTLSNLLYSNEDFGVSGNWHFFPTSHGKSPADGVGGAFKRSVYNRALSGQFSVYNAKDFVDCGTTFAKKTRILLSSANEMSAYKTLLESRWKNVKIIKGTRESHFFAPSEDGQHLNYAISSRLDELKTLKLLKK